MIFFAVDYTTDADCLRCHPGYTPEELLAVKPDKFNHKSTGVQAPGTGEKPKNSAVFLPGQSKKDNENSGTDRK
jgi:hypothetical protein